MTGARSGFKRQPFELLAELIKDPASRDTADRIRQFLDGMLLSRFEGDHFEFEFTQNETGKKVAHNLGFQPQDLWITSQIGSATITTNYTDFDKDNLDFDISGLVAGEAVTIRFFAGSFVNEL